MWLSFHIFCKLCFFRERKYFRTSFWGFVLGRRKCSSALDLLPINLFPVCEKRADKSVLLVYYLVYVVYFACSDIQGELTYGKIGEWRFDKRSYDNTIPPRNLPLPPRGVPESVVCFISPFKSQGYCCIIRLLKSQGYFIYSFSLENTSAYSFGYRTYSYKPACIIWSDRHLSARGIFWEHIYIKWS